MSESRADLVQSQEEKLPRAQSRAPPGEEATAPPAGGAEESFLDVADDDLVTVGAEPVVISLKSHWRAYILNLVAGGLLVVVLAAAFEWLYIGAAWNVDTTQVVFGVAVAPQKDYSGFPAAAVAVLPPPTSLVNATVLQPYAAFTQGRFGFEVLADVVNREGALRVVDGGDRAWSLLFVPETFARDLAAGLLGLNGSVPPAIEYIHDSGRHLTSDTSFLSAFNAFYKSYRSTLAASLAAQARQLSGGQSPTVSAFWTEGPVRSALVDIHPVLRSAQNLHSFISYVVLYIASILTITITSRIHEPNNATRQGTARLVVAVTFMTAQVLVVSIVAWCLPDVQGSFGEAFGWWLLVGYQTLAFVGLFYTFFGRLIGQAIATLLLYVSLSSSSALVALPISPLFFHVGYALPAFYAVHGARAIYFGSQRHLLSRDAGVVVAWLSGCAILVIGGYLAGVNVKLGRKLYDKTRRKIVVPPMRAKGKPNVVDVAVKV